MPWGLSEIENELFELTVSYLGCFTLTREELRAMRSLADDSSIIIKKSDECSCVDLWVRQDYIVEAEK